MSGFRVGDIRQSRNRVDEAALRQGVVRTSTVVVVAHGRSPRNHRTELRPLRLQRRPLEPETAAGQGLALLPILACSGHKKDDLQRVLPEYATVGVPLQLVYPTARFLPKRVVLLGDHLMKELPPSLKI